MPTTDQSPVDRLIDRHALLRLSAAGMVDLYAVLDEARDKVRAARRGEDPAATLLAGVMAGIDIHEHAMSRIPSGRRGEVWAEAKAWLPDVVSLSESDYRLTVKAWARRASVAADAASERRKAGVRA